MDIITLIKYILLGLIQGIAEILPISSSGHLALFQQLLETNAGSEATFALLLHFGSLVALLFFFRILILRLLKHAIWFIQGKKSIDIQEDMMLIVYLVLATIPSALIGLFIKDSINEIFANLWFTAFGFLFTAALLWFITRLSKQTNTQPYTLKNTLVTGVFQILGLFPGVSRSGMTLSGALIGGLPLNKTKEFAFLLFIPITAGSLFLGLFDTVDVATNDLIYMVVSTLVSMVATFAALHYLLHQLKIKHFQYFSYYLIAISVITMIVAILQ
jgi:undecaprenyl-diphosphatase